MPDPFEISFAGVPLLPPDPRAVAAMARYWRPAEEWRHPGHQIGAIDHLPRPTPPPDKPPRCGVLHWPTGASRWASFHQLADEELVDRIRTAVTSANNAATLKLADGARSVSTSMYLLPPRKLADYSDAAKLYLVTLVDKRYFWWLRGNEKIDATPASWASMFTTLYSKLGEAAPTVDTVPSGYGVPTDRWKVHYQPLPLVLDAAAATVGMRVVRLLDGTNKVVRYPTARAAIDALYTQYAADRVFGGRVATADLARSVPASVAVVFYADGTTPATDDTRTLASLAMAEYAGLTAQAGFTGQCHADMKATASSGNRTAYADEAARDWYRWRLADVEATYAGVVPWVPTGLEDAVEWGWEGGRAATCVARPPVADPNLYGGVQATGGGDSTFLVLLTERDYSEDFIEYSAVEVEASGDLTYAVRPGGRTFSPGTTPLYHERNLNFAVVGLTLGVPNQVHPWSVVRARQDPDGFWYFQDHPIHGIARRSGSPSVEGEQAYHRINTSSTPGAPAWSDDIELDLIEAE